MDAVFGASPRRQALLHTHIESHPSGIHESFIHALNAAADDAS